MAASPAPGPWMMDPILMTPNPRLDSPRVGLQVWFEVGEKKWSANLLGGDDDKVWAVDLAAN